MHRLTLTVLAATALLAAALPAAAQSAGYRPSQLERQVVDPDEYGRYSLRQLAMIKFVQEDPDLNPVQIAQRVQAIKRGQSGRFGISLSVESGITFGN